MSWSHARYCDTNQVCNTLIFLLGGLLGGEYAYQYFSVRNIGIVGADRRKMMRWYDYWCDTLWRVVVQSIIDKNVSVDIIIIIIVVLAATWVVIVTIYVVRHHHTLTLSQSSSPLSPSSHLGFVIVMYVWLLFSRGVMVAMLYPLIVGECISASIGCESCD